MKKFFKSTEARAVDTGFGVFLDGRPLKTRAKLDLHLPTKSLAEAIASEWDVQVETIKPETMPLMSLATTAVDLVAKDLDGKQADMVRYGETDLICYYAEAPEELVARQRAAWEPLHLWCREVLKAPLDSTNSIIAVAQPEQSLQVLEKKVVALNHWQTSGMQEIVSLTGSLVISLALFDRRLTADQAIETIQIEENYQADKWGEDEEEAEARAQKSQDLRAAVNFLLLLDK